MPWYHTIYLKWLFLEDPNNKILVIAERAGLNTMLLKPLMDKLSRIRDQSNKLYILFILIYLTNNVANAAANWPDCGFQCSAGDVTLQNAYLGDASGNPLKSCSIGSPVTAYLWITIYNNAGSTRNAVILLADVYVNNDLAYTTYPNGLCVLNTIQPKATSKYPIYSFSWTCGQKVQIKRMVLSWETSSRITCANANRKCSNRGTKCYGGSTATISAQTSLAADFSSNSPQCCCGISFTNQSSGGVQPYTFQWNFGDGSTTSTLQNPTHTYSSPGTYSVTLTVKDSVGTSTSITRQVTLYSHPVAEAGNNLSILPGGSVTLEGNASGGSPPYSFSWSPTSGLSDPSSQNPLASPANTTKYYLTIKDSHGCTCSDSTTVYVSSIKVTKSASNNPVRIGSQVTYTYKIQNTGDSNLKMASLLDSFFGSISSTSTGDLNGDNLLNPGEIWTYQVGYRIYANTTNYAIASATDPTGMMVTSNSAVVVVNVTNPQGFPEFAIQGDNIVCIMTPSTYTYTVKGQSITNYLSTWQIDGLPVNKINADGSITVNWSLYGSGYHLLQLIVNFIDDRGRISHTSLYGMKVLVVNTPSANIQVN